MNRGSILVVDNDEDVLKSRSSLLRRLGYGVSVAATREDAETFMHHNYVDLIVMDVRLLHDRDEFDRSGLDLAMYIQSEIDSNVVVLLTSAFDSSFRNIPNRMRSISKKAPTREFIAKVNAIFREDVQINRSLVIAYKGKPIIELIRELLAKKSFDPTELSNRPLSEKELEDDFVLLFQRLFVRNVRVEVTQILLGKGGSAVLRVTPYFENEFETPSLVVKFGEVTAIQSEHDNYQYYVESFPALRTTNLIGGLEKGRFFAGMKFQFAGTDEDNRFNDFEFVFRKPALFSDRVVENIIEHLFRQTCRYWYNAPREWQSEPGRSLAQSYKKQLGLLKTESWQAIQHEVDKVLGREIGRATVTLEHKTDRMLFDLSAAAYTIDLPNPITFLGRYPECFPDPAYVCITHGDLNAKNIFVDGNHRTWLIDFQRTGWGPALRDAAELESVIKFALLESRSVPMLIQFEQALLKQKNLYEPIHLQSKLRTKQYQRAQSALHTMRRTIDDLTKRADILEYYAGLYFYALKMLKIDNFAPTLSIQRERQEISKIHMLYSAASICQILYDAKYNPGAKK